MNLTELMMRRRSCRKFTDEKLTADEIHELKRVALCAPTSKNCRSWEFVFVTDSATIKALSVSKEAGAAFLEEAPLAVVVLADTTKTDVWVEDTSIAATFLQLKAEEMGLGSCWAQMRGRGFADGRSANDIIKALVGAPEQFEVECVIGIGHKAQERNPYTDEKLPFEQTHDNHF
ncbi:MAG: nitroreductase family protein [Bacteroidales bacterium]|nr:nitroreductase family protein [Bacteroidales bacterium]